MFDGCYGSLVVWILCGRLNTVFVVILFALSFGFTVLGVVGCLFSGCVWLDFCVELCLSRS